MELLSFLNTQLLLHKLDCGDTKVRHHSTHETNLPSWSSSDVVGLDRRIHTFRGVMESQSCKNKETDKQTNNQRNGVTFSFVQHMSHNGNKHTFSIKVYEYTSFYLHKDISQIISWFYEWKILHSCFCLFFYNFGQELWIFWIIVLIICQRFTKVNSLIIRAPGRH